MLSSGSDRPKTFDGILLKNPNLDNSVIALHAFPSRTNLKLQNVSITPKWIKKVGVKQWLYSSDDSEEL